MNARAAVREALADLAPVFVDPPVLQPSDVYLELLGDELRRRAFLIEDEDHELCLRPDMTVPAVRAAFAMQPLPARIAYEGVVFRRQSAPGGETEFVQAGAEWLAPDFSVAEEAAIVAAACAACRKAGIEPSLSYGDVALREGFIAAMALNPYWGARVSRAFARGDWGALSDGVSAEAAMNPVASAFAGLDEAGAEAALSEVLALAGITRIEGRPAQEIAQRLRAQGQRGASPGPSREQIALLQELAALRGPGAFAAAARAARAAQSKILPRREVAEKAVALAEARFVALQSFAPKETNIQISLGREVAFYDGFVFELASGAVSLGGGGRYDGLSARLWPHAAPAPAAAGFALSVKRIEEAAS